ncbi:MAG TPA: hypothetical protein VJ962_05900 [Clostridia bacterium]|nr:hypothetical protein [Clostridia bacterium]
MLIKLNEYIKINGKKVLKIKTDKIYSIDKNNIIIKINEKPKMIKIYKIHSIEGV